MRGATGSDSEVLPTYSSASRQLMSFIFAAQRTRTAPSKSRVYLSASLHLRFGTHKTMTVELPPRSPSPMMKVLIMGSGNFGSCLADHLADSEHKVSIWCRSTEVIESFNKYHKNPKYLKDHTFPESIEAIGPDLPDDKFMTQMDVVLFAVPTQGLRCKHQVHSEIVVEDSSYSIRSLQECAQGCPFTFEY